MPGHSPPPKKRTRRGTDQRAADKVVAPRLPWELLTHIVQYAATAEGLLTTLALSQTCRSWRDILLKAPWMWRDARLGDFEPPRDRDIYAKKLVELCAERSQDTITHADLRGFSDTKIFSACLAILKRSAGTLIDLHVDGSGLCHCTECTSQGNEEPDHWNDEAYKKNTKMQLDLKDAGEDLLALVSRATRLERLVLNFSFNLVRLYWRNLKCQARPMHLTVIEPIRWCCPQSQPDPEDSYDIDTDCCHCCAEKGPLDDLIDLLCFFGKLARKVTSLVVIDPEPPYSRELALRKKALFITWPFDALHNPKPRFCQLPLNRVLQLTPDDQKAWAYLEELRIGDLEQMDQEHFPYYWGSGFKAPILIKAATALQRLCASPVIATKIEAPSIKCAFLQVRGPKDMKKLPQVLKSWPQLESLTIEVIDPYAKTEPGEISAWVVSAIKDVIRLLTPGATRTLRCPKLRHPALLAPRSTQVRKNGNLMDPRWASLPCSEADINDWCAEVEVVSKQDTAKSSKIASELIKLELRRRQLEQDASLARTSGSTADTSALVSSGYSDDSKARTLRDSCAALEIIKLGGVDLDCSSWQILHQSSKAQVICHREPWEGHRPWSEGTVFSDCFDDRDEHGDSRDRYPKESDESADDDDDDSA